MAQCFRHNCDFCPSDELDVDVPGGTCEGCLDADGQPASGSQGCLSRGPWGQGRDVSPSSGATVALLMWCVQHASPSSPGPITQLVLKSGRSKSFAEDLGAGSLAGEAQQRASGGGDVELFLRDTGDVSQ